MRKPLVWSAVTAGVGLICLLAFYGACNSPADPAADPELALPPALVTPEELGGRQPLFDAQTTTGWQIEGPHRVQDGTLELGGAEAVSAVLQRSIEEGEQVEFDFFQEGQAGATLRLKPTLIDPQPPDPEFLYDIQYNLHLWDFLYPRWHHVDLRAGHEGTNTEVTIDIRPQHDWRGREGQATHSLPGRGGCRYQLLFQVAPGAKLYLRNVLLGGRIASEPSPQ